MISSRNRDVVVMSQFNINGSRGADAGKFVSDYVSRDSATDKSLAYIPNPQQVPVQGDGVAFTLDDTAISRRETLDIADRVQELHSQGDRAIQQMVISFDHDYLVDQGIVPEDTSIIKKGDYRHTYDDVRLRHAVRSGLQSLIDNEGYRDGRAVGCIQWDTRHIHVHVVVYEDADKIARKRGREEKGVIKESSLNQLTYDISRRLQNTKTYSQVPNELSLLPNMVPDVEEDSRVFEEPVYVNEYMRILQEKEREAALRKRKSQRDNDRAQEIANEVIDSVELDAPNDEQTLKK